MMASAESTGAVIPQSLAWHGVLAVSAGYFVSRALAATWRMSFEGAEPVLAEMEKGPVIFCTWHNRLALAMPIQRWFLSHQPRRRLGAMVSASKDGAVLARFLEHHAVQPVRGSTSRRGPQALLEFTRWTRRGYDVAITPDGPRGPRCEVQPGIIMLAQLTGMAIVPVSSRNHPKKVFGSWDKFELPLPFAKCVVRMGEVLRVPRKADAVAQEAARRLLEERMNELGK